MSGIGASSVVQKIVAEEKAIGVWLNPTHIVLCVMLLFALLGGVYLFESKRADVAEAKAEAATLVAKAAQEAGASAVIQNAAQQEKDKEIEAAMSAANSQLITANQQLQASNASLVSRLVTQQKTDTALPPSGQALRIEQLEPRATVTPIAGGFTLDGPGGLAILQDLEELPVDRAQIANLNTEVANEKQEIANDGISLAAEKSAHAGDVATGKQQLVAALDTNKATLAEFNAYKKKSRRNVIRAFFIGVVVGVVGGHAAGI